ncbi:MAG TPA: hypothetical protein VFE33_34685 [Thermoanaerobaculia bacterium]|nr:hypothetical protein [Thermoanaerobaculia bacterium]
MRGGEIDRAGTPRWEPIAAAALTLAVAALHVLRLVHAGGLWRDEAGAARLATLPTLGEIYHLFPHAAFPLLFPAVLRAWSWGTGGGDPALRAFGLAVGLGIVGLLWWNARATAKTVPILSLALLGLDVPFLVYGDAVRGYGLGSGFLLLTYGLLARGLVGSGRTRGRTRTDTLAIAATAFAAVASVQVVLGNAALLFALCAAAATVAAVRRRWGQVGWSLGYGALAALSLLPYAGPLAAARRQWSFIVVYPIGLGRLRNAFLSTLGPPAVRWVWLLLLVAGLAALVREWRRGEPPGKPGMPGMHDAALFAALTLVLALLANGAFLKVLGYSPRPWYFLPLLALLGTALDTLGGALSRSGGRFALLKGAAVCLVAGMQLVPLARYATLRQTNVDLVARQVARPRGGTTGRTSPPGRGSSAPFWRSTRPAPPT